MVDRNVKIFVTRHRRLVGSAILILRLLQAGGYGNLVTRGRTEFDLTDQQAV